MKKRKPKYRNKKITIDGIRFDSKKEARYYGTLKLLKRSGEVKDFELQPRFDFKINGKLMFFYKSDFKVYYSNGKQEIIDIKSEITRKNPVYRIKKKIIEEHYQIKIIEK